MSSKVLTPAERHDMTKPRAVPTLVRKTSQSSQSFVHISHFGFNTQILIKDIIVNDRAQTPRFHLRCRSGEASVLTPYAKEPLEFCLDPEATNPSTDSLLVKLNPNLELEFQFTLDKLTLNLSSNESGTSWFLLHTETSAEAQERLQALSRDTNYYFKQTKALSPTQLDTLSWKWKYSPLQIDGVQENGHKNVCSFVKRTSNEFHLVAKFSFWVSNLAKITSLEFINRSVKKSGSHSHSTSITSVTDFSFNPPASLPHQLSRQNTDISDLEISEKRISEPLEIEVLLDDEVAPTLTQISELDQENSLDLNVSTALPYANDDGPVFRATVQQLEKKVHSFKQDIKRIVKLGQEMTESFKASYEIEKEFFDAINSFPTIQPLTDAYLKSAYSLARKGEEQWLGEITNLLIDPLRRIYESDIKSVESRKKQFEQDSDDYYSYLSKYLSSKNDKSRKGNFSETKFQEKQRYFELSRFNYYSFIHELRGGGKDQEVISHFSSFAEKHLMYYATLSAGLYKLKPKLDQIQEKIEEANKELFTQRKDRDEKRRQIIKSDNALSDLMFLESKNENASNQSDSAKVLRNPSVVKNKFQGIRDLQGTNRETALAVGRKKEGFLFTHSRQHITTTSKFDKNIPGPSSWHKKWCVLSGGYLHEYSNWKKQLEANFEPVPLQFATVRVANQKSRKFCFEVVTPKLRRQYQATSEEDMMNWITCIANAIESIWNGTSSCDDLKGQVGPKDPRRTSEGPNNGSNVSPLRREITDGENTISRQYLVERLRKNESNCTCADCDAPFPEWCSINFGILLCIECSGIHRSLGTHVTKVRSLTLDVVTFTPDLIELMERTGNAVSNGFWEYKLDENNHYVDPNTGTKWLKPTLADERTFKLKYVTAKYIDHTFIPQDQPYRSLDGNLVSSLQNQLYNVKDSEKLMTAAIFAGILQEDIVATLHAIVVGGNSDGILQVDMDSPFVSVFGVNAYVTPLHVALFYLAEREPYEHRGTYCMAELLVQNGANVSIQLPYSKFTPLHFAAIHNNLEVIQYLLLKGASPTLPNDDFESWPCFLASESACQQLLNEVTYNEGQKNNLDAGILQKVVPPLPPRIKSGEGYSDEICENGATGDIPQQVSRNPSGSPSFQQEEKSDEPSFNFSTSSLSPSAAEELISNDKPTDLGWTPISDNRNPASPIKRLSGGWKQQLQNFTNIHKEKENRDTRERDGVNISHGHSHSMGMASTSIPQQKKNLFRRSGHPFTSQDLSYLASSAPLTQHKFPSNLVEEHSGANPSNEVNYEDSYNNFVTAQVSESVTISSLRNNDSHSTQNNTYDPTSTVPSSYTPPSYLAPNLTNNYHNSNSIIHDKSPTSQPFSPTPTNPVPALDLDPTNNPLLQAANSSNMKENLSSAANFAKRPFKPNRTASFIDAFRKLSK